MKRLVALSLGVVALVAAAPAEAAEPARRRPPPRTVVAPPPPVLPPWTGFYIGVNAGAGFNLDFDTNQFAVDGRHINLREDTVFVGGAQIGYNHQFSPLWVAGVEADIQGVTGGKTRQFGTSVFIPGTPPIPGGDIVECVPFIPRVDASGPAAAPPIYCPPYFIPVVTPGPPASPGTPNLTVTTVQTAKADLRWFGTARGRLGFLMNPLLLFYVTGGFAYGDVDVSSTTVTTITPGLIPGTMTSGGAPTVFRTGFSDSKMMTGYAVGFGSEYKLSRQWSIKGEYLYVDLGRATFPSVGPNLAPTRIDVDLHVARLGLNFNF